MKIEVLGSGCRKCTKAADEIDAVGSELNADFSVEKVTDPKVMMQHKVMSTPAVVVDGKLVHSGSVPDRGTIRSWFD